MRSDKPINEKEKSDSVIKQKNPHQEGSISLSGEEFAFKGMDYSL